MKRTQATNRLIAENPGRGRLRENRPKMGVRQPEMGGAQGDSDRQLCR
jgi:hypothetical protein